RQNIFKSNSDRERFLWRLEESANTYNVWSSYRSYAGLAGEWDFVEYGPALGLVGGQSSKLATKETKQTIKPKQKVKKNGGRGFLKAIA
ncbi:hypothetical protein H8D64_01960, partial [PVC group bacterium]|nr:hypothetical protein [PVC group bacterium]